MFRKSFIMLFSISLSMVFCLNVSATNKKPTLSASGTKLPEQCKKMFSMADSLISEAERQPGTHTQVAKLKSKLFATKQQIIKMESELQQKSCDKGLVVLNSLKQKH